jgi:hypothetical protein
MHESKKPLDIGEKRGYQDLITSRPLLSIYRENCRAVWYDSSIIESVALCCRFMEGWRRYALVRSGVKIACNRKSANSSAHP